MASLLDPVIDAEQRYAEDPEFHRLVCGLEWWLAGHGASLEDGKQAMTVLLHRADAEKRDSEKHPARPGEEICDGQA